ncbi:MAG: hypothetical protein HYY17_15810 [Planctomycetes bacterium]|nr:hypothetical protein [Planctomycetota bacterium]
MRQTVAAAGIVVGLVFLGAMPSAVCAQEDEPQIIIIRDKASGNWWVFDGTTGESYILIKPDNVHISGGPESEMEMIPIKKTPLTVWIITKATGTRIRVTGGKRVDFRLFRVHPIGGRWWK